AEEHRHRLGVAVAGGDQALLQLAHLRRGAGRALADALQRVDEALEAGAVGRRRAELRAADLAEPLLDDGRAGRRERHGGAGDEQRDEHEREKREQQRHDYTSILITRRIQMYPMVCITIAPMIIIWPMRSLKSSDMWSGLIKL